jgi:AcrR family transcriptional regulator
VARGKRGADRTQGASRRNRTVDVMEAAVDIFWRKGYAASSVQDIADAVGVLKGSLYHYIDSKEDLLFRILDEVHTASRDMLDEVLAMDRPPLEQIRHFVERHVLWGLENLKELGIAVRDWRHLTGERLEQIVERRRDDHRYVREVVARAQAEGAVDPGMDPRHASFFLLSAISHVPDWYRAAGEEAPEAIARAYAELAVGTLVGTTPAASRDSMVDA